MWVFLVNFKSHFKTNLDIRKNYQIECIALKISHRTNTYKTDAVFNKSRSQMIQLIGLYGNSKIYKTCSLHNLKVIRHILSFTIAYEITRKFGITFFIS